MRPRLGRDTRGRCDRRGCHDLARRGDVGGAGGEDDDRTEDVAVAQQHVAGGDPGARLGEGGMLGEGSDQAEGNRARSGLVGGRVEHLVSD
jgi:hypothetical protein